MNMYKILLLLGALLPLAGYGESNETLPRGDAVFKQHCVVCHGGNADGDSALGRMMNPHPANLRRSALSAVDREHIVRKGGAALGRSSNMPAWENDLSNEEIVAVVAYVGSLRQENQDR